MGLSYLGRLANRAVRPSPTIAPSKRVGRAMPVAPPDHGEAIEAVEAVEPRRVGPGLVESAAIASGAPSRAHRAEAPPPAPPLVVASESPAPRPIAPRRPADFSFTARRTPPERDRVREVALPRATPPRDVDDASSEAEPVEPKAVALTPRPTPPPAFAAALAAAVRWTSSDPPPGSAATTTAHVRHHAEPAQPMQPSQPVQLVSAQSTRPAPARSLSAAVATPSTSRCEVALAEPRTRTAAPPTPAADPPPVGFTSIRIGSVDVEIVAPPPEPTKPVAKAPPAAPAALARGLTPVIGLRQS